MLDRLPEIIDPLVFAERRIELKGTLKIKSLTRLEGLILDDAGVIEVELFFNKQGRHAFIDGWASTTLIMQCQNCLDAVDVPIKTAIKLGLITNLDYADRLPAGYEPLIIDEEKMLLKEIVEDELLLALPAFPKHLHQCVKFELHSENSSADLSVVAENATLATPKNPFAVLAKLKPTGEP
ncbi:MAG: metal-binding protein [Methylococcaceae bacterium]|nr:metal-binding protein [Methylococcaceae bacterium]